MPPYFYGGLQISIEIQGGKFTVVSRNQTSDFEKTKVSKFIPRIHLDINARGYLESVGKWISREIVGTWMFREIVGTWMFREIVGMCQDHVNDKIRRK